jgi:hypothetical protein
MLDGMLYVAHEKENREMIKLFKKHGASSVLTSDIINYVLRTFVGSVDVKKLLNMKANDCKGALLTLCESRDQISESTIVLLAKRCDADEIRTVLLKLCEPKQCDHDMLYVLINCVSVNVDFLNELLLIVCEHGDDCPCIYTIIRRGAVNYNEALVKTCKLKHFYNIHCILSSSESDHRALKHVNQFYYIYFKLIYSGNYYFFSERRYDSDNDGGDSCFNYFCTKYNIASLYMLKQKTSFRKLPDDVLFINLCKMI